MQIDKEDYSNKIYKLLHPNLRYYSEVGDFTSNLLIPKKTRDAGFLKMISDLITGIALKQKNKVDNFDNLYDISKFLLTEEDDLIEFINIDYDLGEVRYDTSNSQYYFYFFKKRILDNLELFNEAWSFYDGNVIKGVSYTVLDMDKTEEVNDTNYYYRIYIGSQSLSLEKKYLLFKPSLSYYIAKNKSIPLHLLNSKRCNISLFKNAYKFFTNKSSISNIREVAWSLEADIELNSYSVISNEYFDAINKYKVKLAEKLSESINNNDTISEIINDLFVDYSKGENNTLVNRNLIKGIVFATRFEDFRIDMVKEYQSIIVVDGIDYLSIKNDMNKEIVIKDIDFTNNSLYDYSFIDNKLYLNVNKSESESIFFKRIGEPNRWFLQVEIGDDLLVYSLDTINITSKINMIFSPFFENIDNYNELGVSLYDYIENNIQNDSTILSKMYYEYFYYRPVSYASNLVQLNLKNEINSSQIKSNFNLYKYNKKVIDIFMPDYYEVIRGYVEFNGERTLF